MYGIHIINNKMVSWLSNFYNGNIYTGKTDSIFILKRHLVQK